MEEVRECGVVPCWASVIWTYRRRSKEGGGRLDGDVAADEPPLLLPSLPAEEDGDDGLE